MLNVTNVTSAKKSARTLERFLETKGLELQHGHALDAMGAMAGLGNWASLSASLSLDAVNSKLSDFERAHITGSLGDTYSEEVALVVQTGFELRFGLDAGLVDYVRLCDPRGREFAYWTAGEWQEDPSVVVTAILTSISRGVAPQAEAVNREALISVSSVPFADVSAMTVGGVTVPMLTVEYGLLALLSASESEAPPEDTEVLMGYYEDERDEATVSVTFSELQNLTWSHEQQAFLDPDGKAYVFHVSLPFRP